MVGIAAEEAGFWCPVLDGRDGVLCAGAPGRAALGGARGTASLLTPLLFSPNAFAHRLGGSGWTTSRRRPAPQCGWTQSGGALSGKV